MATHSGILAWRIPQTEEPGGLQSTGSKESDMTERLTLSLFPTPRKLQRGDLEMSCPLPRKRACNSKKRKTRVLSSEGHTCTGWSPCCQEIIKQTRRQSTFNTSASVALQTSQMKPFLFQILQCLPTSFRVKAKTLTVLCSVCLQAKPHPLWNNLLFPLHHWFSSVTSLICLKHPRIYSSQNALELDVPSM